MKKLLSLLLSFVIIASLFSGCEPASKTYILTFNDGGEEAFLTVEYLAGQKVSAPLEDPEKPLFDFKGWYADAEFINPYVFGLMPARDITVYALFKPIVSYTIELYNDGRITDTISLSEGAAIALPTPEKTYYEFAGWYTEPGLDNLFALTAMPPMDIRLYAGWVESPLSAKITYMLNGEAIKTVIVAKNEAIVDPELIDEDEFNFSGWFTDEDCTLPYNFDIAVNSDITLFAKSSSKKLTLSSNSVTGYTGKSKNIIIPEGVTSIADYAFFNNTLVKSIHIPSTVISIGKYAFTGCQSLTQINLPSAVTLINEGTFAGCVSLKSIALDDVTYIDAYAFSGCTALTTIGSSIKITGILGEAFKNCGKLEYLSLSSSVTDLAVNAFFGCTSLSVDIDSDNMMFSVIDGNIYNKSGNELLYYLAAGKQENYFFIPDDVTRVEANAFNNNTNIRFLETRSSADIFEAGALSGLKVLSELIMADLGHEDHGYLAYYFGAPNNTANGATSVYVPKTLTRIEFLSIKNITDYAFYGCTNILDFYGLETAVKIEKYAFAYSGIKSIYLGNSVTPGDSAFIGCRNLIEIKVSENNTNYSVFDSCLYSKDGKILWLVPAGKKTVSINPKAEIIAANAFEDSSISDLYVPDTVKTIEKSAFRRCNRLISINLPFIGGGEGTTDAEYFSYIFGATQYVDGDSDNQRNIYSNAASYMPSSLHTVTIREQITKVPDLAFYFCDIAYFNLPNTVTAYGNFAFAGNEKVLSFNIPYGITDIGVCAFGASYNITKITVPGSVRNIGREAFSNIIYLSEIIIEEGVTELSDSMFFPYVDPFAILGDSYGAPVSYIEKISLPASLRTIGVDCFAYAGALPSNGKLYIQTVHLDFQSKASSKLYEIKEAAFFSSGIYTDYENSKYKLNLPGSLEIVESLAFYRCIIFNDISFGGRGDNSKLRIIGDEAFSYCYYLTSVSFYKTIFQADEAPRFEGTVVPFYLAGANVSADFTILVPNGNEGLYKQAWPDLAEIILQMSGDN